MAKTAFPLQIMRAAATDLATLLRPNIARGKVCGSVRRCKPECADIEIVYEPLPDLPHGNDLFGEATSMVNPSLEFLDSLVNSGVLEYRLNQNGHRAWGKENRLALYNWRGHKIPVDLFAVYDPAIWGNLVAIRTGSAQFNCRLLNLRRRGGWMPDNCRMTGGFYLFKNGYVVECPTEESFFKELEVRWIDPRERHEWSGKHWRAVVDYQAVPA